MNDDTKVEPPVVDPVPTAGTGEDQQKVDPAPSPDPTKSEPEKKPKKFTKRQTLKYNIDRLSKEHDAAPLEEGDEVPVVPKTALELSEEIEDAHEKGRVQEILKKQTPSGNAVVDLRIARLDANSERNTKLAEEANRKPEVRRTTAASGAPAVVEQQFTPTAAEHVMMLAPFNMTKDEIIAVRKKEEQAQK